MAATPNCVPDWEMAIKEIAAKQQSASSIVYVPCVTQYTSGGGLNMLRFPHHLSDTQLGLMLVVVLPLLGGAFWLYNAYRMGKLKWKPAGPANPRIVTLVIFIGIVLVTLLLAVVG